MSANPKPDPSAPRVVSRSWTVWRAGERIQVEASPTADGRWPKYPPYGDNDILLATYSSIDDGLRVKAEQSWRIDVEHQHPPRWFKVEFFRSHPDLPGKHLLQYRTEGWFDRDISADDVLISLSEWEAGPWRELKKEHVVGNGISEPEVRRFKNGGGSIAVVSRFPEIYTEEEWHFLRYGKRPTVRETLDAVVAILSTKIPVQNTMILTEKTKTGASYTMHPALFDQASAWRWVAMVDAGIRRQDADLVGVGMLELGAALERLQLWDKVPILRRGEAFGKPGKGRPKKDSCLRDWLEATCTQLVRDRKRPQRGDVLRKVSEALRDTDGDLKKLPGYGGGENDRIFHEEDGRENAWTFGTLQKEASLCLKRAKNAAPKSSIP